MKRPCDVESIEDMYRYYQNGYISAEEDGVNHPYWVHIADRAQIYVRRMSKLEGGIFELSPDDITFNWDAAKEKFSFGVPEVGMLQNFEELRYGSRVAARQSSRGLRLDHIRFTGFNTWAIRAKCQNDPQPDWETRYDLIWDIFNPKYKSVYEATEELNNGDVVGVPLSQMWGLYTLSTRKHPVLAYKRWTVGYMPTPYQAVLGEQFKGYKEELQAVANVEVV